MHAAAERVRNLGQGRLRQGTGENNGQLGWRAACQRQPHLVIPALCHPLPRTLSRAGRSLSA